MWVVKFHGETYYVNHVDCDVPWSTKETPDNSHTKGSIKVKNVLLTIDDDNCARITTLTFVDKIRLRNQKLGITRIIFNYGGKFHKAGLKYSNDFRVLKPNEAYYKAYDDPTQKWIEEDELDYEEE